MKTLYILVGPKGAGKTTIGAVVHSAAEIHFLRVEPIWLALPAGTDGWQAEEQAIDNAFACYDKVMIETLGVGEGFERMLSRLREKYAVRLIKVETDPAECLRRVRRRDSANHIAVSDEQVIAYNAIATGVAYDWDAVIDNNGPATQETILAAILGIG